MVWIVRMPIQARGGIKYDVHEFKTKREAERYRKYLKSHSEIYKVTKMR